MLCCIGLDNPKFPVNIGSVLRAAENYGVNMVAASGKRYKGSATDTMKAHRRLPLIQVDDLHDIIPFDCVPVAVDLIPGAIPLMEFKHPKRAFYIFGAEDATLGSQITSWCKHAVFIPTNGCMNLAATVNVVLYDRLAKSMTNQTERVR